MANHLTLEEREIIAHMQRAEVRRYVGERLRQRWSPDQIAGRSRNDFPHDRRRQVSPPTIYAWIRAEEARGKHWQRYLRRLGPKAASAGKAWSVAGQREHRRSPRGRGPPQSLRRLGRGHDRGSPSPRGPSRWSSGGRDTCCWARSPICRRRPFARPPPNGMRPPPRLCGRP